MRVSECRSIDRRREGEREGEWSARRWVSLCEIWEVEV
jgi:hypothetical protein